MTNQEFIRRARQTHGDRYLYEEVDLVDETSFVVVTCPDHGHYVVDALLHLQGKGCPICSSSKSRVFPDEVLDVHGQQRSSFIQNKNWIVSQQRSFIERARAVHGDKYGYDKVEYVSSRIKVTINCPVHGDSHKCLTTI